ncbi:PREDICTED: translation initiation factor IF-2 [Chinchilla lanigera]|uniref:translation initiation factor IF-2 n=1 Tax=Chinchilla lanigera TaxID=34839 RepID=UPI0006967412|nr:PREDICTED: translation initiation factor IF-2 [Chinchilla lanigera]
MRTEGKTPAPDQSPPPKGPTHPRVPAPRASPSGWERGNPCTAASPRIKGAQLLGSPSPAREPQSSHGPRLPQRPAPRSAAAAAAYGGRRQESRRSACDHRAALPLSAARARSAPQEHPERRGDGAGTPLPPNRSRGHAQGRSRSLSRPGGPHGAESPAEDAEQKQSHLTPEDRKPCSCF